MRAKTTQEPNLPKIGTLRRRNEKADPRPDQPLRGIPLYQRRQMARLLANHAEQFPDQDLAITEAFRTRAYSMQAIANHFSVDRMTVSRAVKKHQLN